MKRFISMMALLFTLTFTANAMSYEQARQQALFLTDKMAYELNLTDDQYEAAYEINLDYLMSVNTVDDLYGSYWRYRNLDMSYVLLDWQYRAFCDASYFYRPLYFSGGYWRFGIYARYPHRDYFYFSSPRVYVSYRGGHSWGMNHGRSWYDGRHFGPRPGDNRIGMRDGFNRGDYGRGFRQSFGNRQPMPVQQRDNRGNFGNRDNCGNFNSNGNRNNFGNRDNRGNFVDRVNKSQGLFGNRGNDNSFGNRESSTRTTVKQPSDNNMQRGTFGSRRDNNPSTNSPRSTFSPSNSRPNRMSAPSSPSFGGSRGSFGGGQRNGGGSSNGGGFGSRR